MSVEPDTRKVMAYRRLWLMRGMGWAAAWCIASILRLRLFVELARWDEDTMNLVELQAGRVDFLL